jgi:hypothetical protein
MRYVQRSLRYLWASPATAVGVMLAALAMCAGATLRSVDGAFEVAGGRLFRALSMFLCPPRFVAITFGHIILGIDHVVLSRARVHEHVHVQQYERWGVLFFPLYVGSSLVQVLRGRNPYLDNVFEREAYSKSIT